MKGGLERVYFDSDHDFRAINACDLLKYNYRSILHTLVPTMWNSRRQNAVIFYCNVSNWNRYYITNDNQKVSLLSHDFDVFEQISNSKRFDNNKHIIYIFIFCFLFFKS